MVYATEPAFGFGGSIQDSFDFAIAKVLIKNYMKLRQRQGNRLLQGSLACYHSSLLVIRLAKTESSRDSNVFYDVDTNPCLNPNWLHYTRHPDRITFHQNGLESAVLEADNDWKIRRLQTIGGLHDTKQKTVSGHSNTDKAPTIPQKQISNSLSDEREIRTFSMMTKLCTLSEHTGYAQQFEVARNGQTDLKYRNHWHQQGWEQREQGWEQWKQGWEQQEQRKTSNTFHGISPHAACDKVKGAVTRLVDSPE
ncbi:hypothetical protein DFH29DRAFT_1065998 [Suillus ampliporus]|nr:hypothetical protein DFH29DRAFT_1065998 [Suillus ampliporus]